MEQAKKPLSGDRILTSSFVLLWFSSFSAFGTFHVLLATLPVFVIGIGGSEAQTGLILGIFSAAAVIVRPFVGQASDLRSKKTIMLAAAATTFAATLLYIPAHSVGFMFAVRFLHGLGWGAFSTAGNALLADLAPERRRGEAVGYYGVASNLAMGLWPVAGVFLQQSYGFPVLFYSTALIGLVCVVTIMAIREPVVVRQNKSNIRFGSVTHLFERSALLPASIVGLLFFSFAADVSFMPLLAHERGFQNPGLYFTVFAVVAVMGRLTAGKAADRYGRGPLVILGMLAAASSQVLLAFSYSLSSFLGAGFLMAAAYGTAQPALIALNIDRAKPESRGIAMGTLSTATDLGVSVGSLFWGFILQFFGYITLFLAAGGAALAGVIVFVVARRVETRHRP